MRVLVLPVERGWYAVPMDSVDEVIARPEVALIPTAPSSLLGVFNLRGEIVPLFDTAALLETGSTKTGSHIVVIRSTLGRGGLLIHHAPESAELEEPVARAKHRAGVAVYGVGERLVTLLDLPELLGTKGAAGAFDFGRNSR